MNVEKSVLDIDLDDTGPPKPKVAPGEWDPNADLASMTMAEQLQWQKIANQKKQEAKAAAAAAGGGEAKKDGDGWDPNADMSKMTMAE